MHLQKAPSVSKDWSAPHQALQSSFAQQIRAGFVWGTVSAVLSRVFASRVSAPGFPRGSTSAVLARGYKPRASGEPKARP